MKVIYMPVYKTVIYAGEELVVPDWVKFIATNSDGGIWGYSQQPTFLPNTVFDPKDKGGKWLEKNYKTILGYAQLVDTAPENTLVVLSKDLHIKYSKNNLPNHEYKIHSCPRHRNYRS